MIFQVDRLREVLDYVDRDSLEKILCQAEEQKIKNESLRKTLAANHGYKQEYRVTVDVYNTCNARQQFSEEFENTVPEGRWGGVSLPKEVIFDKFNTALSSVNLYPEYSKGTTVILYFIKGENITYYSNGRYWHFGIPLEYMEKIGEPLPLTEEEIDAFSKLSL